jgi:hypothetical protein
MTATTREDSDAIWNSLRTKAINDGLAEDNNAEELQEIMDKYFAGIPYNTLRKIAEEHYPEEFI